MFCNPIHKVYYEGFVEQWNDVINQTSSTKHCCVRYCDLIFCFGLRTTDLSLLLGLVDAANLVFIFSCQSAWNYSDCCFFRLSTQIFRLRTTLNISHSTCLVREGSGDLSQDSGLKCFCLLVFNSCLFTRKFMLYIWYLSQSTHFIKWDFLTFEQEEEREFYILNSKFKSKSQFLDVLALKRILNCNSSWDGSS